MFRAEEVHLEDRAPGWLERYTRAAERHLRSPLGRKVLIEDSVYIAERAILPPGSEEWDDRRVRTGLVMGAVQSGKTASMLGVLAHALDEGVHVAVLLGGTQTSLWRQTAERVGAQLDVGDDRRRRRLMVPELASLSGDTTPGPEQLYAVTPGQASRALRRGRPLVVTAMKQVDHLYHLGKVLHEVVYPAARSLGIDLRLLVVDDEADDASIEDDWGALQDPYETRQVPRLIRELWETRREPGTAADGVYAVYLAYTATPQANFLLNPERVLAPREFVAALRTPGVEGSVEERSLSYAVPDGVKGWYTGADVYYGALRQHLCVPITDVPSRNDSPEEELEGPRPEFGEAHVDAIRAYLVAAAIRHLRHGDRLGAGTARTTVFSSEDEVKERVVQVSSMLIHATSSIAGHHVMAEGIRRWWGGGEGPEGNAGVLDDLVGNRPGWQGWLERYRASAEHVASEFEVAVRDAPARLVPDWEEVEKVLRAEVIPGTRISVVNSSPEADDGPSFTPVSRDGVWHAAKDLSTIFVAGNVMSRGLTLEGLLTTIFTRRSDNPAADTQMQMQRWFGYRGEYIDLCRLFLPPEQLELFAAYAEYDKALRAQVLAAMKENPERLPDFTILHGDLSQPTGKISSMLSRHLHPGSRPVVLHLNAAGRDEQNQALVNDFFLRASGRDEIVVTERGLVTRGDLTILETADLLDGLRYERLGHRKDEAELWEGIATGLDLDLGLLGGPLYRAPEVADRTELNIWTSPYNIAAYLRSWAACVGRRIDGLNTDEDPPQAWNLIDPAAQLDQLPRFRVALRLGSGDAVTSGPLLALQDSLRQPLHMMRRAVSNDLLEAGWGSRSRTDDGYLGDDQFDYLNLGESPRLLDDGSRARGEPGLLLFQLIQRDAGEAAISVGLSIPRGGPVFNAARRSRKGGVV